MLNRSWPRRDIRPHAVRDFRGKNCKILIKALRMLFPWTVFWDWTSEANLLSDSTGKALHRKITQAQGIICKPAMLSEGLILRPLKTNSFHKLETRETGRQYLLSWEIITGLAIMRLKWVTIMKVKKQRALKQRALTSTPECLNLNWKCPRTSESTQT